MSKKTFILLIACAVSLSGIGLYANFSSLGNGYGRTQNEACTDAQSNARNSCAKPLGFLDSCHCQEAWKEPSGSPMRWACSITVSCADQNPSGGRGF